MVRCARTVQAAICTWCGLIRQPYLSAYAAYRDKRIADHVLGLTTDADAEADTGMECASLDASGSAAATSANPAWSTRELRDYIAWAKASYQPTLSQDAQQLLLAYYQRQRQQASLRHHAADQVTVRFLEGLVRLSQAHARLLARREVSRSDASAVLQLLDTCAHVSSVLHAQYGAASHAVCDIDDDAHAAATEQLMAALNLPSVPLLPAPPPPPSPPRALPAPLPMPSAATSEPPRATTAPPLARASVPAPRAPCGSQAGAQDVRACSQGLAEQTFTQAQMRTAPSLPGRAPLRVPQLGDSGKRCREHSAPPRSALSQGALQGKSAVACAVPTQSQAASDSTYCHFGAQAPRTGAAPAPLTQRQQAPWNAAQQRPQGSGNPAAARAAHSVPAHVPAPYASSAAPVHERFQCAAGMVDAATNENCGSNSGLAPGAAVRPAPVRHASAPVQPVAKLGSRASAAARMLAMCEDDDVDLADLE